MWLFSVFGLLVLPEPNGIPPLRSPLRKAKVWSIQKTKSGLKTIVSRLGLLATSRQGLVFTNLLLRASRQATSVL
jgi:hypothetical protein